VNHLTGTIRTALDGATATSAASAALESKSLGTIKARTLSGAIAKKTGGDPKESTSTENNGGGLVGAGAGAGSENEIINTVIGIITRVPSPRPRSA
jgi:hypothetical protein